MTKKASKGRFQCLRCTESFETQDAMEQHHREKHGEKTPIIGHAQASIDSLLPADTPDTH